MSVNTWAPWIGRPLRGFVAGIAASGGSTGAVAAFTSLNLAIYFADYYYARANLKRGVSHSNMWHPCYIFTL